MLPGKLYGLTLVLCTVITLLLIDGLRLEPPKPASAAQSEQGPANAVVRIDDPRPQTLPIAPFSALAEMTVWPNRVFKPAASAAADSASEAFPASAVDRKPEAIPLAIAEPTTTAASAGGDAEMSAMSQVTSVEPAYTLYVSTAHYLNVREQANNRSRIVDVIAKGTELRVVGGLGSDWLALEGGGYVHGSYTELAAPKPPPTGLASAESTAAKAAAAIRSSVSRTVKRGAPAAAKEKKPLKPGTAVQSESGLTVAQIAEIMKGTALSDERLEETILEVEREFGINAYFTIAVMRLESGNGKSRLARKKNNLFGLNAIAGDAYNKALSFDSKQESIRKFGELIFANYVNKGLTTVEKIAGKYCPANEDWPGLVREIMHSDYRKIEV